MRPHITGSVCQEAIAPGKNLSFLRGLSAEILFLDDKPENVSAAGERGWQTICHHSAEESTAKVRDLVLAA